MAQMSSCLPEITIEVPLSVSLKGIGRL
jgi:hypothetical protein